VQYTAKFCKGKLYYDYFFVEFFIDISFCLNLSDKLLRFWMCCFDEDHALDYRDDNTPAWLSYTRVISQCVDNALLLLSYSSDRAPYNDEYRKKNICHIVSPLGIPACRQAGNLGRELSPPSLKLRRVKRQW